MYLLNAQLTNTWVAFLCGPFSALEVFAGGNVKINLMNNFVLPLLLMLFALIYLLAFKELSAPSSIFRRPWLGSLPLRYWEVLAYPVAATYLTSITSWLLMGRIGSGTSVIGVSLSAALLIYSVMSVMLLVLAVMNLFNVVNLSARLLLARPEVIWLVLIGVLSPALLRPASFRNARLLFIKGSQ